MRPTSRQDAASLLLIAVLVVSLVVYRNYSVWLDWLIGFTAGPVFVTLVAAPVIFACVIAGARVFFTRRALTNRVSVAVVPADLFDPSDRAVSDFAAGLSRTRRAVKGLLEGPASAVRVRLAPDPMSGRLGYAVELPAHARQALSVASSAYDGVELCDPPEPEPEPGSGSGPSADLSETASLEVARAELVLARPSTEPLHDVGLDPDPLAGFARAVEGLRLDKGETATVCVDLLPVTPGGRRRLHRRLLRQARRQEKQATVAPEGESLLDLLGPPRPSRSGPSDLIERRASRQALTGKLGSPEPLFFLQVLVRVASPVPGRAQAHVAGLVSAFDTFSGYNHLHVRGLRIPGLAFLGADAWWRRGGFDRRVSTGLFRPARRGIVTATEIAAFLKPPSVRCASRNVVRSGGIVPPAPNTLPVFSGQPGLLPIGRVTTAVGERLAGVPVKDTFFAYMAGRSRFGKTETAIGQFLHLALSGRGCLFLDPHEDALVKIKPYLTEPGVAERVIEINLADGEAQPGWNLLAATDPAGVQRRTDAVVDAFASALRWDEINTRALNLTTQAAHALTHASLKLPPELSPTLFQIPTLLANDAWRAAVLQLSPVSVRQFFGDRFPRLSPEAITPVTNLIDRLRATTQTAVLLGNPTSSYDIRRAMDEGKIVLICPGSGTARDRLLANFFVYDILHAAKTRTDLPPERRREFHVFLDEVQTYDGSSAGTLAALLEQAAKYGVRHLFNQNPERLTAATLNAVTTNRSHLITTALNSKAAGLIAREMGGRVEPETIAQLPRYNMIGSVTVGGEITTPFRISGVPVEELFPDAAHPERVEDLDALIGQSTNRVPVAETLARLDEHDQRIFDHLAATRNRRKAANWAALDQEPPQ